MPANAIISRINKRLSRVITFTGASGLGLVSVVVPIFTVTGLIRIISLGIQCLTTFVSAGGGTLALGTAGNTSGIIGATTATALTNTTSVPLIWNSTTPVTGVATTVLGPMFCNLNIIITVATATVTAGALEFDAVWEILSPNGMLS